ncbi:RlpA-like double-psi beta-barrel domain-containing protein [Halalkalibacter sp. AB-rgal2]|uniref:RlpA-like double-psi beta-barrel domain-containing protein n=1 Tax=Halalkalibacter sp. AB-rgal2 TaxID=3242695 RepID=UPI00359E9464
MYVNGYNPYAYPVVQYEPMRHSYSPYRHLPQHQFSNSWREQTISGDATWTNGGPTTQCGLPWTMNQSMTAAVSEQSTYRCGDTLRVRNRNNQRELTVIIVDTVPNFPSNRINLHRQAFEALGAQLDEGLIPVDITSITPIEEDPWSPYLQRIVQSAFPNYQIINEELMEEEAIDTSHVRRTYELMLQSPQESIRVQAKVNYNPTTNRVISFDLQELNE